MPHRSSRMAVRKAAALAVWAALSLAAGAARGQEAQVNPGLAPLLRYFELGVHAGRIRAASPHRDRKLESQAANTDGQGNTRRERLSVTLSGEATTVSYQQSVSDWHLSIEILDGKEVSIRRESKNAEACMPLVFHQPAVGPLSLRLGEGAELREFVADNLWRLLVSEPEACSEFSPLLELLKPNWNLAATAQAAEQALYASVRAMAATDQTRLRRLVGELASDKFARRQAADRSLRAAGRDALPSLMSIDWRRLDAEQRFRLGRLFRDLSGDGVDDTPERVALGLIHAPKLWLKLLERDDESHRRLALEQLERLLGRRLAFDPAADATTRLKQLAALQESIAIEE
jgi:hypothetical protein